MSPASPTPKSFPTADELIDRLAVKFPPPEWAFVPQAPNGTLYTKTRTADALAFNCWKSRGMEIHGFEVKVHRGDWLRELDDPEKAEDTSKFCDRWWIVVDDKSVLQPGELPPTWGLMVPMGKGLHIEVAAPQLKPLPVNLYFMAAVMRRLVSIATPQGKIDEAHRRGVEAGKAAEKEDGNHRLKNLSEEVAAFEKVSGVRIRDAWNAGDIGGAVKALMNRPNAKRELRDIRQKAERILAICSEIEAEGEQ